MADPFLTDLGPDSTAVDYLGVESPIGLKGQTALPVTGAPPAAGVSAGPATTAQAAAPSSSTASGITSAITGASADAPGTPGTPLTTQIGETATGPAGAISSPGSGQSSIPLRVLQSLVKSGARLADLERLFASPAALGAGAIDTPSGQQTISAPEILREIQFPADSPAPPDVPGGTFASEGTAGTTALSDPTSIDPVGTGLNIYNLAKAIEAGNPEGIATGAVSLGVTGAEVGAALGGADAAGLALGASPIGGVVGGIELIALINDLMGTKAAKKQAAQEFRTAGHDVGVAIPQVEAGAQAAVPLLSGVANLSDQDVLNLALQAEEGVKGQIPLGVAFQTLEHPNSINTTLRPQDESANQAILANLGPVDYLALLRSLDVLQQRGAYPGQIGSVVPEAPPGSDILNEFGGLAGVPPEVLQQIHDDSMVARYWQPDPSNPDSTQVAMVSDVTIPGYGPGNLLPAVESYFGGLSPGYAQTPLAAIISALEGGGGQPDGQAAPSPAPEALPPADAAIPSPAPAEMPTPDAAAPLAPPAPEAGPASTSIDASKILSMLPGAPDQAPLSGGSQFGQELLGIAA